MKTIVGKVSVGVANPIYDKEVELEVVRENTGYDGRQTLVRTVQPVHFTNNVALIYKNGRFLREEPRPDTWEIVEGWLVK